MRCGGMSLVACLAAASLHSSAPAHVAAMTWRRRVLLVSAPSTRDPALVQQRQILAAWRAQALDRDLSVVEIVGDTIIGAADSASALRRTFRLPPQRFTVVLVGKDGGEKLRSATPLASTRLEQTIDAMPMRRAGGR